MRSVQFSLYILAWMMATLSPFVEFGTVRAQTPDTAEQLREVIVHLSDTIGERNLTKPKKLEETSKYVQSWFEKSGYTIERQNYQVSGVECSNLIAEVPGTTKPNEIVVVGAHYDSARGAPGANDNGSGLAAMMVLAQRMKNKQFTRTLRWVAFTNEEPPYFQREEKMGSWVYAKSCRKRGDDIKVVLSLETMGYFSDEPKSQKYPPPLAALYPSTGNFIGFVSNIESRPLLTQVVKAFRSHCKVDAQLAALPAELQGVGWSDHWSFWQEGYPGVMITDTAPFRYPHYHEATDTVDKITFEPYAAVVDGLAETIIDLANEVSESKTDK